MSNQKLVVPQSEAKKLLSLPTREAEQLFQSYEKEQQLEIIRATRNPKQREELYYLVPDCTELIQDSPTEDVLQVLDTLLGTGLACGLLPCLSNEQFEEIIDIAVWRDGKLDENSLNLWLFELSECERDDLSRFLGQIDIRILAGLLKSRVSLKGALGAMLIDEGIIDPSSPSIDCKDEKARAILNAIWEADADLFNQLMREMFVIDKEADADKELVTALEKATAERAERVKARDSEAGIKVTESDLKQQVDLDSLELAEDEEENADE
ncbi:MAG: DUF6178 family protein [Candidatus Poribacteria bacterium]|nr:DUF6178 family protein [Candidatus Poribacteria bacterium]